MRKIIALFICMTAMSMSVNGQQGHRKLSKEEMSKMTQEQRLVHENDRKSKGGKRELSLKKKERISRRQDRKSKRISNPKRKED